MEENTLPLQVFFAGQDQIINNEETLAVLQRGRQDELDVVTYPDQTHSVQFEIPERLTTDMHRWIMRTISDGQRP